MNTDPKTITMSEFIEELKRAHFISAFVAGGASVITTKESAAAWALQCFEQGYKATIYSFDGSIWLGWQGGFELVPDPPQISITQNQPGSPFTRADYELVDGEWRRIV